MISTLYQDQNQAHFGPEIGKACELGMERAAASNPAKGSNRTVEGRLTSCILESQGLSCYPQAGAKGDDSKIIANRVEKGSGVSAKAIVLHQTWLIMNR